MKYEKYKELLAAKYSLDVLWGLKFLKDGEEIPENIKQGIKRKEWIDENNIITPLGEGMLGYLEGNGEAPPEPSVNKEELFTLTLRKKLQDRLFELTKKKQIMGFGGKYFMPTEPELRKALNDFVKYGYRELYNEEKIEKVLLIHIRNCFKKKSYSPAIQYYIIKDKVKSEMASALENFEEGIKEIELEYDGTNI